MPDVQTSSWVGANSESRLDLRTLLLAQKTELIGELTRAIANQFNNTMMAITSYAELEMKKLPASQKRSLEQVLTSASRATSLVQKLLGISRNLPGSNEPLDLNAVVAGIGPLVEQLAGEKISVVYDLEPGLRRICSDPSQIEQVALSLAINARNAMPQGGQLTFATKLVDLDKHSVTKNERPGKYVMFAVADTGAARQARAWDLEGSTNIGQEARINLSLAAVHAVVKGAEGMVRFASDPAKGSRFSIYFPPAQMDAGTAQERTTPRNLPMARTVLLVEDDDAVRIPTAELLKMEGFKVLQARAGEEAIHVAAQNRSPLDVLITDVVMPKMSGHEVAQKLLEMNPNLKVLFMSGEEVSASALSSKSQAATAALRKPFRLDVLKDKIHDLLDE